MAAVEELFAVLVVLAGALVVFVLLAGVVLVVLAGVRVVLAGVVVVLFAVLPVAFICALDELEDELGGIASWGGVVDGLLSGGLFGSG